MAVAALQVDIPSARLTGFHIDPARLAAPSTQVCACCVVAATRFVLPGLNVHFWTCQFREFRVLTVVESLQVSVKHCGAQGMTTMPNGEATSGQVIAHASTQCSSLTHTSRLVLPQVGGQVRHTYKYRQMRAAFCNLPNPKEFRAISTKVTLLVILWVAL